MQAGCQYQFPLTPEVHKLHRQALCRGIRVADSSLRGLCPSCCCTAHLPAGSSGGTQFPSARSQAFKPHLLRSVNASSHPQPVPLLLLRGARTLTLSSCLPATQPSLDHALKILHVAGNSVNISPITVTGWLRFFSQLSSFLPARSMGLTLVPKQ